MVPVRQVGLLLDVPLLQAGSRIDGRLDDKVWEQVVTFDTFYQVAFNRSAAYFSVQIYL